VVGSLGGSERAAAASVGSSGPAQPAGNGAHAGNGAQPRPPNGVGPENGVRSAAGSAAAGEAAGVAVVLTGDFNALPASRACRVRGGGGLAS
jgi:hypothetical protein